MPVAGLLGGCADALDQTNDDINSPAAGMMHLADQMHAQGDDEGAMEFYARAVQRAPDDVPAHLPSRRTCSNRITTTRTRPINIARLSKLKPDNADYRRAYGRVLIKLGTGRTMPRSNMTPRSRSTPDDVKALNGLGVTLDLLGDHAGAQEKYKAALAQKSDDLVTVNNLGHSYVLAGRYDEAVKTLEPYYHSSAAPPALRQNLAAAYAMNGMDVDAGRVLKVDLPPDQVKKTLARYHAMRAKAAAPRWFSPISAVFRPPISRRRASIRSSSNSPRKSAN